MFDHQKKQHLKMASCAHASDKGHKRDHNEDSYIADSKTGLFIIADGMGGYEGGAVASSIVVRSLCQAVSNGLEVDVALNKAHREVLEAVKNGLGCPGMGSTAVALKIKGTSYQVAWVGDSRAYLWDGSLKRLTHDHSLVQKMMDTGVLSENEARLHPQRNILTQALGVEGLSELTVESVFGHLYQGQKIMLCSDGLTGELEDDDIAEIMARHLSDQACASALIQAANNHGGKDNITVILVSSMLDQLESTDGDDTLPMGTRVKQLSKKKIEKRSYRRALAIATLLLAMIISACWGYLVYIKNNG